MKFILSTSVEPKATFDRRVRNTLTNKLRVFSLEKKERRKKTFFVFLRTRRKKKKLNNSIRSRFSSINQFCQPSYIYH